MHFCSVLLLLHFSFPGAFASRWTEQDEARRIAQLKEQERLEFQMEMQQQENGGGGYQGGFYPGPAGAGSFGAMSTAIDRSPPRTSHYSPYAARPSAYHQESVLPPPRENFCYHCASPFSSVSPDLQKALQMFLKMRRTRYPSDAVTPQCSDPRNVTALARQSCLHSHCMTLVLTEHDTGSAFTIRGCAEHFGAIDEEVLEERGDNTCSRLHEQLDIQECICKHRRYCYSGPDRRVFEAVNANPNSATPFMRFTQVVNANRSAPCALSSVLVLFMFVLWRI